MSAVSFRLLVIVSLLEVSLGGTSYGGTSYGGTSYGGTSYGGTSYGGTSYGGTSYASPLLNQHLVGPAVKGESNFYLDLWQPPKMRIIAPGSGLTNNHALFINSHGKGVKSKDGIRYVFYPHEEIGKGQFFIEDIAAAVGAENAPKIHNIVISACNTDSTFDAKEVRKHFPNATNVIHSARGEAGYQEMLFQLLLADSSQVETLYQSRGGDNDFEITNQPVSGCKKMSPYVATLFRPGKVKPYRTQKAGRELLTKVPLSAVFPEIPLN